MKTSNTVWLFFLFLFSCSPMVDKDFEDESKITKPKIIVNKVYGDETNYCSFTSLIKRDDVYYVAFRVGKTHASDGDYGIIRILRSLDCSNWEEFCTLSVDNIDLRDPDLCVLPDGKIQVHCGARILTKQGVYVTQTYYADEDNNGFTEPAPIEMPTDIVWEATSWIWRTTWRNGIGYGVCYGSNKLILLKTFDGHSYKTVTPLTILGEPSECRIRFKEDGTAIMLVRRDQNGMNRGYMGKSSSPYIDWEWKELSIYLAGEDFLIDEEKVIIATRMIQNIGSWTALWFGNVEGDFNWCYTLPFGCTKNAGDTAYAGMLNEKNEYIISYHAVDSGDKPSVFLARIPKHFTSF